MAASHRACKATVDYTILSGKCKCSIQSRVQGTRGRCLHTSHTTTGIHAIILQPTLPNCPYTSTDVDMADRTQDLVLDCALNQLTARCSNNPEALKYFREQLLRDPVPQGVFVILTVCHLGIIIQPPTLSFTQDLICCRPDFMTLFFISIQHSGTFHSWTDAQLVIGTGQTVDFVQGQPNVQLDGPSTELRGWSGLRR